MRDGAPGHALADLARRVGGELRGPGDVRIATVNSLDEAGSDALTYITDTAHARRWGASRAAAALLSRGVELTDGSPTPRPLIIVPDALLALNELLPLFQPVIVPVEPGVHPTAWVHPTARIGPGARIGPHVSIDRDCILGRNLVLHAGARLYHNVSIGDDCIIHANCVIREHCTLGSSVDLHQNVSIGGDGFGYHPAADGSRLVKILHVGNVVIEDHVEIGTGTCVDRAKFGSTIVGWGTKIDNLCQIGHNCRIGRSCVIAGLTGLAGSVVIEDGVRIGGCVGIADHIHVGRRAQIGAKSAVMRDVEAGQTVLGLPAGPASDTLRQWGAFRKLPGLLIRLQRRFDGKRR